MANSSVFVLPRITAPCSIKRRTLVAVYGGRKPSRIFEPQVVGTPSRQSTSLIAIGIPCTAGSVPARLFRHSASLRSACPASCSARSGVTARKACKAGLWTAMASRQACVKSREDSSPARSAAAASSNVRSVGSAIERPCEGSRSARPHSFSSRTGGTRNIPSCEAAALARMIEVGVEGRTESGRSGA